jgi:HD-GYP domain-containing protein (c-di-GMP phosphodiesterase class II)
LGRRAEKKSSPQCEFATVTTLLSPSLTDTVVAPLGQAKPAHNPSDSVALLAQRKLEEAFRQPFAIYDLEEGSFQRMAAEVLRIDFDSRLALCEEICRRGTAEIIEDCAPLVLLAVPLPTGSEAASSKLALATFVTQAIDRPDEMDAAATTFGVPVEHALSWSRKQLTWPALAAEQLSRSIIAQVVQEHQSLSLRRQLSNLSQHLLQTFEELNLLHRLNEHLSLSSDEGRLMELALQWLSEVLPTECLIARSRRYETGGCDEWTVVGDCPLENDELDAFFESLGPEAQQSCLVLDAAVTERPTWNYVHVREVLTVPIRSTEGVIGHLMALNRKESKLRRASGDFGSLELSLLSSVAAILGMHSGNVELFRSQGEFFEGVVRALSSAIDAKDPYTRGHSERVARISVCIARKLGLPQEELDTLYLSGLLHDIGKIGIEDHVLRKPGNLTAKEYEHIKQHPQLGYQILSSVRQLEHVLPVVLHHHEAWDGSGYPYGLVGADIPRLARIASVADSFDAMTSDRPYRKGMSFENLRDIFLAGAGQQWDPEVVDAYFDAEREILSIVRESKRELTLDVPVLSS